MDNDKMQGGPEGQQENETRDKKQPHSSPFKEPVSMDQKSTTNPEQEADLEQQRKEALTERD